MCHVRGCCCFFMERFLQLSQFQLFGYLTSDSKFWNTEIFLTRKFSDLRRWKREEFPPIGLKNVRSSPNVPLWCTLLCTFPSSEFRPMYLLTTLVSTAFLDSTVYMVRSVREGRTEVGKLGGNDFTVCTRFFESTYKVVRVSSVSRPCSKGTTRDGFTFLVLVHLFYN